MTKELNSQAFLGYKIVSGKWFAIVHNQGCFSLSKSVLGGVALKEPMPLFAFIIKVLILKSKVSIYMRAEGKKVAEGLVVSKKHSEYLELHSSRAEVEGEATSDAGCPAPVPCPLPPPPPCSSARLLSLWEHTWSPPLLEPRFWLMIQWNKKKEKTNTANQFGKYPSTRFQNV